MDDFDDDDFQTDDDDDDEHETANAPDHDDDETGDYDLESHPAGGFEEGALGSGMAGYAGASPNPTAYLGPNIVGTPAQDMQHWHWQSSQDTCAVAAQEFILDSLTGYDFSEQQLAQEAYQHGWYTPGAGTPLYQTGNLLEAHGFQVERRFGVTFEELSGKLARGEKIIVGVDSNEIWTRGLDNWQDNLSGFQPGIPGQGANHAVEVIGIDYSNPHAPQVILNDPGIPNGRGMTIPANDFMGAWADSGYYTVSTNGQRTEQPVAQNMYPALQFTQQPRFTGYYNADGTYHYSSDNTDRDPETGAIVRRW